MSHRALKWAARLTLPHMEKIVLMMLSDRHNDLSGKCHPSHNTLADDCGMSRTSVIRQIGALKVRGLITIRKRSKSGRLYSNHYILHMDKTQSLCSEEGIANENEEDYLDDHTVDDDVHEEAKKCPQEDQIKAVEVVSSRHQVVSDRNGGSPQLIHKPGKEPGKEPIPPLSPTGGVALASDKNISCEQMTEQVKRTSADSSKSKRLASITAEAIAAYNASPLTKNNGGLLPNVHPKIGIDRRSKQVKRCVKVAREICKEITGAPEITFEFWKAYFELVMEDDFFSGRIQGKGQYENFVPDFDTLTQEKTLLRLTQEKL